MVVTATDLVLYEPSFLAASDADPVGGTIDSGLNPVDGLIDEIFFTSASKPVGQGDNIRYSKVFGRNNNTSLALSNTRVYIGVIEHAGQIEIALEQSAGIAILDGDQLIAGPQTAPTVSAFSAPSTYATGLTVGNSGLLGSLQAQGIWLKQSISEGIAADVSAFVDIVFGNN